jgi:predicted nucleic acid-binding protein
MILVDSSVWIDFFNGHDKPHVEKLYQLLGRELIATGDLIMVEVLQGFSSDKDFRKAQELFEILPCFSLCSQELAFKAARNYRFLGKNGVTVRKTIDMVIGTFCIENNLDLLHADQDFKSIEKYLGLRTIYI